VPTFNRVMDIGQSRFIGREMAMVHRMFRREFSLAGGVVRRVACGDTRHAHSVAAHLRFIGAILHHHHSGEDNVVWPLLVRRAPAQVSAHVLHAAEQHRQVDAIHAEVDAELAIWRHSATAAARDQLAEALDRLAVALIEHMDYEESYVVPVMEAHIDVTEWDQIVCTMASGLDPANAVLAVGMRMYEADCDVIERTIKSLPPGAHAGLRCTAALAYAEHAQLIHGTPIPPRSTEIALSDRTS
jgi:iron-sulfur cluster repair protein YtfE (RIC family)